MMFGSGPSLLTCVACVFFFQAEDGIRYLTVTGVQTCALPICSGRKKLQVVMTEEAEAGGDGDGAAQEPQPEIGGPDMASGRLHAQHGDADLEGGRSEERRVGKEGRSRWSPDHLKKKKRATVEQ